MGFRGDAFLSAVGSGMQPNRPVGVGMLRPREQRVDGPFLDHLARVHDEHPVADLQDEAQVVRDVDLRGAVLAADVGDELGDAGLDRDVERGGRLVEEQERGVREQRHRDDHALLLPARDLVRVRRHHAVGVGEADVVEHLHRAVVGLGVGDALVGHRHLLELGAEGEARIERGERLLVDHRDVGAAQGPQLVGRELGQLHPLEPDAAALDGAVAAHVLHDGHRHRGLAAARLAHQPDALALLHREREVDHGRDLAGPRPVRQVQIRDFEDRCVLVEVQRHGSFLLVPSRGVGGGPLSGAGGPASADAGPAAFNHVAKSLAARRPSG